MKIKTNTQIIGIDDKPLNPVITLKDVIERCLLAPEKDEDTKKKMEKYELYKKVHKGNTDFVTEEIALMKKLIGKFEYQLIMGQCFDIIEENNK